MAQGKHSRARSGASAITDATPSGDAGAGGAGAGGAGDAGAGAPPPEGGESKSASGRLFDLRWLIAAMFVVYGVVLTVVGILDNAAEIKKAAGVRINLWTGIGMLVIGLFFAAWARWKPLSHDL